MGETENVAENADKRVTNKEANKLARDVITGADMPFTAGEIEHTLRVLMGIAHTKEGKCAMRVVDTVLQSERKAGRIAFAKGKWTKVTK